MRSLSQFLIAGTAGIAAAAMLPGMGLAGHGKAGLWQVTTSTEMPGLPAVDMSRLPPEVQERMKAMHMQMTGKGVEVKHCMTQAEVDQGKPPMAHKGCKLTDYKATPASFTGDMVCTGQFNGKGHMQVRYDSNEHYTGSVEIDGVSEGGQPVTSRSTFEGRWLSPDCGGVSN